MRILAAMILSVTGAVTAFLAVLTALDDPRPMAAVVEPSDRLAGFAAPDLADSHASLAAAAPQPASSVARFAAPPVLAESRLEIPEGAKPVRAAFVPPIKRRLPIDPAPPADDATAAAAPTAPAAPAAPVLAEAKPVRAPVRAKAAPGNPESGQSLDTSTRSALGGPRPATVKTPKPNVAR